MCARACVMHSGCTSCPTSRGRVPLCARACVMHSGYTSCPTSRGRVPLCARASLWCVFSSVCLPCAQASVWRVRWKVSWVRGVKSLFGCSRQALVCCINVCYVLCATSCVLHASLVCCTISLLACCGVWCVVDPQVRCGAPVSCVVHPFLVCCNLCSLLQTSQYHTPHLAVHTSEYLLSFLDLGRGRLSLGEDSL